MRLSEIVFKAHTIVRAVLLYKINQTPCDQSDLRITQHCGISDII